MTTFNVSNAAELNSALAAAQGGDQIVLASGEYGEVTIARRHFSSEVTIRSADPDAPAEFQSINVTDVSNLTFDGIFVDFTPDANTVSHDYGMRIVNSDSIAVLNSKLEGGPAVNGVPENTPVGGLDSTGNILGLPTGRGMIITNVNDLRIENNEISQFHKGITLAGIDGATFLNNEIHDLRTTPLSGGDLNNIVVDGNHFYNARPWQLGGAGDHGDLLHFWTDPDQVGPSTNIKVTNNFFQQGDGAALLGIYFDDNANQRGFSDVLISNNVIFNGDRQAIRLENVHNSTVSYNTLLQSSGDANDAPVIVLRSDTGVLNIHDNIIGGSPANSLGEDANGNVYLQRFDPLAPNYYGHLFVDALSTNSGLADLQIRPGSALAGVGAGAAATQFDSTPDALTALISGRVASEDGFTVSLDGLLTADQGGFVGGGNATFSWDFGDGTTGSGINVEHEFGGPGSYLVVLRVDRAGVIDETRTTIVIQDPMLLDLDLYTNGARDVAGYLSSVVGGMVGGDQQSQGVLSAHHLNDSAAFGLAKASTPQLFGLDEFTLSFSMKRDSSTADTGAIMRIHGSWYVSVDSAGELVFQYADVANTSYTVRTSGANLKDAAWHSIDLSFDSEAGVATFYVDGRIVGQGAIGGRTQSMESWGFALGNPFGNAADAVVGSVQLLNKSLTAAEIIGIESHSSQSFAKSADVSAPAEVAEDKAGDDQPADTGAGTGHSSMVVSKVEIAEKDAPAETSDDAAPGYWFDDSASEAYAGLDTHRALIDSLRSGSAKLPVNLEGFLPGFDANAGTELSAPAVHASVGGSIAGAFAGLGDTNAAGQSSAIFERTAVDLWSTGLAHDMTADLRWHDAPFI